MRTPVPGHWRFLLRLGRSSAHYPCEQAAEQGYAVYVPTDACGGVSSEAHGNAVRRMTQHGIVPTTWLTTLLEWQRDWGRTETYDGVLKVVEEHAGAYGLGVSYAHAMVREPGAAH
jgi:nicotinamidase-related amidase